MAKQARSVQAGHFLSQLVSALNQSFTQRIQIIRIGFFSFGVMAFQDSIVGLMEHEPTTDERDE